MMSCCVSKGPSPKGHGLDSSWLSGSASCSDIVVPSCRSWHPDEQGHASLLVGKLSLIIPGQISALLKHDAMSTHQSGLSAESGAFDGGRLHEQVRVQ